MSDASPVLSISLNRMASAISLEMRGNLLDGLGRGGSALGSWGRIAMRPREAMLTFSLRLTVTN
jgi:hypothetical protein